MTSGFLDTPYVWSLSWGDLSRLPFHQRPSLSALAIVSLTIVIYHLASWIHNHRVDAALAREKRCSLPPELSKRWPLGIDRIKQIWDANVEGHLLQFLCTVADPYEPRNTLYQFLLIGPRAFHNLHPDNVEAILSSDFQSYGFGSRPDIFAPLLGSGIFTQEGAAWKRSRELLRKQFSRINYNDLRGSFGEHVDNLMSCISSAGGVVDLQPLFFNLTLDTTTDLLFGQSVYSLRAGIDQATDNKRFSESFSIALEGLAKRFRIAPFHFLYNPSSFRNACRDVHRFVEDYIRAEGITWLRNKATTSTAKDDKKWFVHEVAAESESERSLRDQLLNVLLAGRDTTACCLSWTFRLLVRHPAQYTRLREEIASVMGDATDPTKELIRQMPFLNCVIKETLRLYPSVPLNNREAIKTTILPTGGGPDGTSPILVRKGELVVFAPYITARRKNLFGEDAELFRPERWETGELDNAGFAYYPFNGGPRLCLGQDFAMMEVAYTVVRLLQAFPGMKLPAGEPVEPVGTERQRLTLVLSSADGCRIEVGGGAQE